MTRLVVRNLERGVRCVKVERENLQDVYSQLFDLIGQEAMLKVYSAYRGQQLTLPMRMYAGDKVAKSVRKQFDGHNSAALMHKYDYSQRWINKAISQIDDVENQ